MGGENAGSSEKKKTRDPDFITAEAAIQRAAQKASEKAGRTGAGVVVLKDGRIVEERLEPPAE